MRASVAAEPLLDSAYVNYTQDGRFDRDTVANIAYTLAQSSYRPPKVALPDSLRKLPLDQYHDIHFKSSQSIWASSRLPFQLQLFIRGSCYETPVEVALVDDGKASHFSYSPDYFYTGPSIIAPLPANDIGFSGLSLLYPLDKPGIYNQVVRFLGASYFKVAGKNENWGASARGLALHIADTKGEEFPLFRAFWVERPKFNSNSIVVNALLDSPSVTGAYRFTIRPGEDNNMDVEATLFPRHDLKRVGLAPIDSMYMFSGNDRRNVDDYRPQVHDSDGLLMVNGLGERLWRPLANPQTLQISGFIDDTPVGYGLMQRDRDFFDYQELQANYQSRPSIWVESVGSWGKGTVTLIEIPSNNEIHNNIVAYWAPEQPMKAGSSYNFSYRLHWWEKSAPYPSSSEYIVTSTRSGRVKNSSGQILRHFVVDYSGPSDGIPPFTDVFPTANISVSRGQCSNIHIVKNPYTHGFQLSFDLAPGSASLSELRAELIFDDAHRAETWLYRWTKK